jgi:hypothetical protein
VAVSVVAGVGLLPSAAHAERSRRVDVPVTLTGNQLTSTLNDSFKAGDCIEWGKDIVPSTPSSVTLTLLDTNGDVSVDWHGHMWTDASFSGDVWHQWFYFKNSAGTVLATVSGLDGPVMFTTNPPYDFHRFENVFINPFDFAQITKVDWWGDC